MGAESSNAPVIAAPLFVADQPLWVQLLVREVSAIKNGAIKGKAGVGKELGFGRAYVSRVIATIEGRSSGFPNGVPQSFIDRVIDRLHVIECPATCQKQPRGDCRKANGPAPTHNPLAMHVWRACQNCKHKPEKE